jgi:hypothetical protein
VAELLGGRFGESFPLYRAISQNTAEEMAINVAKYIDMGYRFCEVIVSIFFKYLILLEFKLVIYRNVLENSS